METVRVETPTLGDRTYLVHDGEVAYVVDPQRDVDRVLAVAERLGVRIREVFETHVHNDYLSGGPALARATGARYRGNAADPVTAERVPVEPGEVVAVSDALTVEAVATPGHTFTHLSYVARDGGAPRAVFTGGGLLYGGVGRPDLLGSEHTRALAEAQHDSAQRLLAALPGEVRVWPTHGFGSFCSSGGSEADESTLAEEARGNDALTTPRERFVRDLLAGLDAYPAYYERMASLNLAGAAPPDLSPPRRASAADVERAVAAGHWVVDLRERAAFAAGHVPGSVSLGLDGNLATYLGWLMPAGTPVLLLGADDHAVAEAQRELVRIGVERPEAAATGTPGEWTERAPRTMRRVTFADVERERPAVVLDVRRRSEHEASHLPGAVNVPIHELPGRLGDVPPGQVWVHCESGYRAALAASLLAAAGRDVVLVDDDYEDA